ILVALTFGLSFVRFFSKLTGTFAKVFGAAQQIHACGSGLGQSAERLWKESEDSGRAVENYVGGLEVLTDVLHRSATEISDADKVVRVTVEDAARGEQDLRTVAAALGELEMQNKKLEEVIGAIDSIAFQTNILAVNAAVEAARAGEHGRGFGIVADAVKSLAQHSTASARNIAELIQQSNETSKRAFEAAQNGAASLSQATLQAKRSQEIMSKISHTTSEMTDSVARLAQSFNQIDSANEQILTAVEQSISSQDKFNQRSAELIFSVEGLSLMLLGSDSLSDDWAHESQVQPALQTQVSPLPPKLSLAKRQENQTGEKPVIAKTSGTISTSDSHHSDLFTRARAKTQRTKSDGSVRTGRPSTKLFAKDVIPFEGESENESHTQPKFGTTSGF
ncbi:MAG: hypothetical protein RJB13_338, partial [Pseudomonadota bacterium]